ncbi:pyruvate synthase subunit beta [bacterium]|nr:pyruvate synthase subunit beta [candidate division CSSED10-310 bacterium]
MVKISEYPEEEFILPGTRLCAGCGLQLAYRWALKAFGHDTIVTLPASCSVVAGGVGGYSPLKIPAVYDCFETGASTASGLAGALKAKGREKTKTVVAWVGDGGTYDIGLQALSAAAERGDDFVYICANNQAYMNTGIQRSSASPYGARTTTTPILGKKEISKNMLKIMDAHGLSYMATASAAYPQDLFEKCQKAKEMQGQGVRYIEILCSCPPGWGYGVENSVKMARLAVETGYWPLWERIHGRITLSKAGSKFIDPEKRKPITDFLTPQVRFKHLKQDAISVWENYIAGVWKEIQKELDETNQ